jgi:hypothetical protein
MEKTANWWTKYYASKARVKLEKRSKIDFYDVLEDSEEAYAKIFAEESSKSRLLLRLKEPVMFLFVDVVVRQQNPFWVKTKKIFSRADKARAQLQNQVLKRIEEQQVKQFFDFIFLKSSFVEQISC